eukprot:TRINITY_DN11364_c2_g1_i1.p1 TRINITY_DN11364_c2_g1~~TRINITY_DN11364_c2_g1_i1.p1  ORF type:complete len:340 (+),score=51.05 TRINITY_DN11364_c2_g1_i1:76-1020(+)
MLDSAHGWLLTASNRLLNLWQCSPATLDQRSQPLQIAQSQETAYSNIDLDIDADFGYIFGGCKKTGRGQSGSVDYISVFSLQMEDLLAEKGALNLQDNNINNVQKVCSLDVLKGKLQGCVATAAGSQITVSKFGSKKIKQRGEWCAHESQVTTQLQLSRTLQNTLISASSEGIISLWDMRDKPEVSILNMKQHGLVSGICEGKDGELISGSFDSYIRFWDLRSAKQPVRTLPSQVDEQMSIFKIAISPLKDMLAVLTMDKVNVIGINDWNMGQINTIFSCEDSSKRPLCVDWNSKTEDLYVAGADAKIRVFQVV